MTTGEKKWSHEEADSEEIDRLCDAFEDAWLAGQEPRIEEFLARGNSSKYHALLRELLLSEWELREHAGEHVAPEDYEQRFAHLEQFVRELWRQRRDRPEDLLISRQTGQPPPRPSSFTTVEAPGAKSEAAPAAADPPIRHGDAHFRSPHGRFLPGTKLAGRYRIVSLVGKGGMGEVYRADDLKLGHTVALKFLPREFAERPHRLEYFLNEVRLSRQISHPNVCRVYDIGEADGDHFLSMEFIDGEDLKGLLTQIGRFPKDKGVEIAQQLCAGLAAAHDLGVLHRDLKPANVMLDGRGQVRITDFGLAILAAEGAVTEIAGTPAYMAPEQFARGKTTIQSDLYSLGLILYEMFTGQRLHNASSTEELVRSHEDSTPKHPSAIVEDIDSAVEQVILRCLEKEPHERPRSARALAAALPGGDPLAAALATGQTPSPELVAHATGQGMLQPPYALACLAAVILMMIGIAQLNRSTKVFPAESPGWLSVHAAKLLEELGHDDFPLNSVAMYDANKLLAEHGSQITKSQLQKSRWPPPYRFWRRWSLGSLSPGHFHRPERVRLDDPPQALPGSATVVLDSTGRLLDLLVMPDPSAPARASPEVDWTTLLEWAKIDRLRRTVVQSEKTPPVHCDTVAAWRVESPSGSGEPFTVQAGSLGGRPIYFEVVGVSESFGAPKHAGLIVWAIVFGSIFLAAIFLAWRNVREGRADRKNAFRVAMIVLASCACLELLAIRLPEKPAAIHFISFLWERAGGHIAIHTVHVWVMYLAIEPYVRRIWPKMLVGWVRLLSGRPADPLVGREILLGAAIGVAIGFAGAATDLFAGLSGFPSSGPILPEFLIGGVADLSGPRKVVITALLNFYGSLLWLLVYASILLVCRLVIKRERLSSAAAAALIWLSLFTSVGRVVEMPSALPAALAISVALSVALVLTITRVGLLAALSALAMFRFSYYSPVSTDLTAWYGPYSLFVFAMAFLIAGYGFFGSLGGHTAFRDHSAG